MKIQQKRTLTFALSIAIILLIMFAIGFINHDKFFKPKVNKVVMVPKEIIIPAKQEVVFETQIVPLNDEEKKAYIEQTKQIARLIEKQERSLRSLKGNSSTVASLTARRFNDEQRLKPYKEEVVRKVVTIPQKKITKQVKMNVKVTKEGLSFEVGNVVLDVALAAISTVLIYFLKKLIDWYFEKKKILLEHEMAATT